MASFGTNGVVDLKVGVMLGDKQLGVTPATVKIPAGEPVTLVIAKDGYPPISQVVVPADGGSVTVPLKKASRKVP